MINVLRVKNNLFEVGYMHALTDVKYVFLPSVDILKERFGSITGYQDFKAFLEADTSHIILKYRCIFLMDYRCANTAEADILLLLGPEYGMSIQMFNMIRNVGNSVRQVYIGY